MSSISIEALGPRRWPRNVRKAFKQAESVAARSLLPEESTDRLLAPLRQAMARSDTSLGSLVPIRNLVGLFDAATAQREGSHHECVSAAVPFVTRRWAEGGHFRAVHADPILSNAFRLLGLEYARFGAWNIATEFLSCAMLTADRRLRRTGAHLSALIYAFLTKDPETIDFFREAVGGGSDPAAAQLLAILNRADADDSLQVNSSLSALRRAVNDRNLRTIPGFGHLVEFVLHRSNAMQLHGEVVDLATYFLDERGQELPAHEAAGIRQELAAALIVTGEPAKAGAAANRAIAHCRDVLSGRIDDELRELVRARFEHAAALRLDSALVTQSLDQLQTYLIEDQLAAKTAAVVEVDVVHPDDDGVHPEAATQEAVEGKGWFPASISRCWSDVLYSNTELLDSYSDQAKAVSKPEFLWLFARHFDRIYWVVSECGVAKSAGCIDLDSEEDLATALGKLDLDFGTEEARRERGEEWQSFDLWSELAEWGSFDEALFTRSLGRLLPIMVRERLLRARLPLLTIAAGKGIPPIPWPVVRVGSPRSEVDQALIELTNLEYWLSAEVALAKSEQSTFLGSPARAGIEVAETLPLLGAIDALDESGKDLSPYLLREAVIHVAHGGDRSADDNRQAIGDLHLAEPDGVFFYRGHMHALTDSPADAFLTIPGLPSESGPDLLHAGQLFGRFESGRPWFPMPRRVVLSCCASASSGLVGHEALSFAAGSIVGGGASEVVATAIEIASSPFTSAFEELLAEAVRERDPVCASLSRLQRQMLDEWKVYSVRGGADDHEAALQAPHPLVWAMYRAY